MNGSWHYSGWGKAPACLPRPAADLLPEPGGGSPGLHSVPAAPTARRAPVRPASGTGSPDRAAAGRKKGFRCRGLIVGAQQRPVHRSRLSPTAAAG